RAAARSLKRSTTPWSNGLSGWPRRMARVVSRSLAAARPVAHATIAAARHDTRASERRADIGDSFWGAAWPGALGYDDPKMRTRPLEVLGESRAFPQDFRAVGPPPVS